MSMLITSEKILRKKFRLNAYDKLFQIESSPEDTEMMAKINAFMSLILPDINAGRVPDIQTLAKRTSSKIPMKWISGFMLFFAIFISSLWVIQSLSFVSLMRFL